MQENNTSTSSTEAKKSTTQNKKSAGQPSELNKKTDISKNILRGSTKKHEQIESPCSANRLEEDIDTQTERRLLGSY